MFTDYLFIWIISFLLLFLRKPLLSYSITIGNILGIFAGQYWGDFFQSIRMAQITINSTPEERWHLSLHYGVLIWGIVIAIAFVIGLLLSKFRQRSPRET